MRTPKRKRHWQADVISAFKRAINRLESGTGGLDDIQDVYKLSATVAAENRGVKDPTTIKRMAEYAEELVEEDHALAPENKHQVLFHFVIAYIYAHVPAGILEEMEADRIMEYLNEALDLFIEPESELSDLAGQPSDEALGSDLFGYPSDVEVLDYDPERALDKGAWLDLDEGEQLEIVMAFHESHVELGDSLDGHAAIHVTIETQIATDTPEVMAALARLMKQGLTRHGAIHAIGSVFFESVQELLASDDSEGEDANERYYAKLSSISADDWPSQA